MSTKARQNHSYIFSNLSSSFQPGMNAVFWSDDNQMIMSNWAATEFDSHSTYCAYINGTDGKWYLEGCEDSKQYVCKISTGKDPFVSI